MNKNRLILIIAGLLIAANTKAIVKLPAVFSNNMVLQQQSSAPFWGSATPGKTLKITTSWDNKVNETTIGADGNWKINIPTPSYGGPYSIEINDGTSFILHNVMIGEVWICSGQSNMEMPLAGWGKVDNYEQEIAAANYPDIRLLQVNKVTSTKPLSDLSVASGGWVSCSPLTVAEFSSVGYFFGKNLYDNLKIPIGLINTSWGGTIAEAWTSGSTLKTMPDFSNEVMEMEKGTEKVGDSKLNYEQELARWRSQVDKSDKGYQNGKPLWTDKNFDDATWKVMDIPCLWEDKDLNNFDGIVWLRKTVNIPAEWQNKELKLALDMIDDNDIAFFNGVEVGRTVGWNLERTYTIPAKLVKSGKAVIVVRVFDTGGGGGIYGNPAKLNLSMNGNTRITLAGTWLYKTGLNLAEIPAAPIDPNNPNRPTVLYNAMIHPLIPFSIRGAIWYQGESNDARAYQYRELFPLMIKDWRKHWNLDFPFYFVQLANFEKSAVQPEESNWAELREAQLQTLHLENTGMAVTIDIGDAKDIHPKNKLEVGRRLALIAGAKTYNLKSEFSGPIYNTYRIEGNTIRIQFIHTESSLKTPVDEPLKGFAVAGPDHKFHWADAKIEGNEIVVLCKDVTDPIAVRYAWAKNPVCNLYNGADLPASPFRTDDWPGVTAGKK
jgi:sialate O-acetylesterase